MTTRESNYYTARTNISENSPKQAYLDLIPRPVATSTQRKSTTKRNLEQDNDVMEQLPETPSATPDTPRTSQRQALAEAILTAMSKGLEPLLAAKRTEEQTHEISRNQGRKCRRVDDVDETSLREGTCQSDSPRQGLDYNRVSRTRSPRLHHQQIRGGKRHRRKSLYITGATIRKWVKQDPYTATIPNTQPEQ